MEENTISPPPPRNFVFCPLEINCTYLFVFFFKMKWEDLITKESQAGYITKIIYRQHKDMEQAEKKTCSWLGWVLLWEISIVHCCIRNIQTYVVFLSLSFVKVQNLSNYFRIDLGLLHVLICLYLRLVHVLFSNIKRSTQCYAYSEHF